jgi:four helix bundle protein
MNQSGNVVRDKSFRFAVRIVRLYQYLVNEKKEYILSKQVLRSGTSVGANIREALNAESTADFIHKLGVSQKEADETMYWLELLKITGYLTEYEYNSIYSDAIEIIKIVRSIIITKKSNSSQK